MVRTSGPATGFVGIGVHTVVYTATDASGNSRSCSFTVTVADNIPPYFSTCQANITTNAAAGQCAVDITGFLSYGIVDNCDMVMTQPTGPDIFAPVPIGVHNITLLLTDPSGNTATCSFVLTVRDVTAPTISDCPANISVNAGASCNATATWTLPTASDDCPGATITRTAGPAPGSTFPVGTTTVTHTACTIR